MEILISLTHIRVDAPQKDESVTDESVTVHIIHIKQRRGIEFSAFVELWHQDWEYQRNCGSL